MNRIVPSILQRVAAVAIALSLGTPTALAGDPFRSSDPRDIGDVTEAAFDAMFEYGDYPQARDRLEEALVAEPDDPMVPAMMASIIYLEDDDDLDTFYTYATQTRETAERLLETDPLRGNIYLAVGHFLEGAYTLRTEGTVRGTPLALEKLRLVFDALDEAAAIDAADPELNIIQGYMDLMLAVNLPFSNPDSAIDRLQERAAPKYLAYRGLAVGYRDLDRPAEAMEAVEKALELTPNNPEVHYLKAQILVESHRHQESLEWFDRALSQRDRLPAELVEQIVWERDKAQRRVNDGE